MQRRSAAILFAAIFGTIVALDFVTKSLALQHLQFRAVHLIDGVAQLRLAFNKGVAFSALEGVPHWTLGAGALLLLAAVLWSLRRLFETKLGTVALALVAAGGICNAIDRLADGQVTDMISVWIWPVFNVADSAITIGVLLLFFTPKKKLHGPEAAEVPAMPTNDTPAPVEPGPR